MKTSNQLDTHQQILNAPKGVHPVMTGLRYKSNGNATGSWVARYWIGGKEQPMGLGSFPEVTIGEARKVHKDNRAKVRMGQSPRAEKEQAVAKSVNTIEATVREAHAAFVPGWKNGGAGNGFLPKMEAYVFPKYGTRPLSELDGEMIADICRPFWQDQKSIADKILSHLSKVIGWAAARKMSVDRMAVKDARILLAKSRYKPKQTGFLKWDDVPQFYQSLGESMSDLGLRFYLLTGVRVSNATKATWNEIQDGGAMWVLGGDRMKRHSEHMVPLSSEAQRVLELATRFYDDPEEREGFIFKNPDAWKTGHISANNWSQRMRRAGVHFRSHGFRTSLRSWGAANKVEEDAVLEEILHHKVRGDTELSYHDQTVLAERRRLPLQAWADFLTGVSNHDLGPD